MRRVKGRIIGLVLGLIVAGRMGALLGFILGFLSDRKPPKPHLASETRPQGPRPGPHDGVFPFGMTDSLQRSTYLIGIIVLSAKLAKSDGRVSRAEINGFRRAFHIPDSELGRVGSLFDEARASAEGYEPYAARLAQIFHFTPQILEDILLGLFAVALADGAGLSRQEDAMLRKVGLLFGFEHAAFLRLAARAGVRIEPRAEQDQTRARAAAPDKDPLAFSYALLGLSQTASDADIKKAYRLLIRKHHPDKLVAKGEAADKIAEATEKMKNLNAAYAAICKDRGIK